MKAKSTILLLYIAWLIAAVMLVFAAVEKQPDSFYTLLRWVCCAVFAYSAVTSPRVKNDGKGMEPRGLSKASAFGSRP